MPPAPKFANAYNTDRAVRLPRLLLALHVAGERGVLVEDLLKQMGASHATLYRDFRVLRRAGWRLDTARDDEDGRVSYALASWQALPKVAPKRRSRAKQKAPSAGKAKGA